MYNKKLSIILLTNLFIATQTQALELSDFINPYTKRAFIECTEIINKLLKEDLKQNHNYHYNSSPAKQEPTVRRFYFSYPENSNHSMPSKANSNFDFEEFYKDLKQKLGNPSWIKPISNKQPKLEKKKEASTCTTFDDIIGQKDALTEVQEVVDFLKNPEKYKRLGAQIPKGILLEGPPGNGKTLMAKAIANEAGCNFVYESASTFVELYVGAGAKHVRELFAKARAQKPCIIFIDEIDAIGAVNRGGSGNEEYRQTINELLCQLDGFETENDIIVIAATNYAQALDKALTRAGRFDRIVKVPAPDEQGRKEILQHYLNKLPAVSNQALISLDKLAKETKDLSCADLKNLVNEATLLAVRDDAQEVELKHIQAACDKVVKERAKKHNIPLF